NVNQATAVRLGPPPAARRVGFAQGGDVLRSAVHQDQAVEVAAVLGGKGGDERRPPARHETVLGVQRTQAREARVDHPKFVTGPRYLMNADVAGDVAGARQITRIVQAARLDLRGEVGGVPKHPDLAVRAKRKTAGRPGPAPRAARRCARGGPGPPPRAAPRGACWPGMSSPTAPRPADAAVPRTSLSGCNGMRRGPAPPRGPKA